MTEIIKAILKREGVLYIIVGCLTTLVNFIIFHVVDLGLSGSGMSSSLSYKIAYVLAFLGAVVFAYWSNKLVVFKNRIMRPSYLLKEFSGFMAVRLLSGLLTFVMMIVLIDFMGFSHSMGWLSTTIINLVLNYLASKFWIFKG